MVMEKIRAQACLLKVAGHPDHTKLSRLAKLVRSGDPDNVEARAARFYWRRLMGDGFRRDPKGGGLNAHLNYGYTVVRAAMARAIIGAGLTPALGLHHRSRLNSFQLVDDLMEPFRPLVDYAVWRNRENWNEKVETEAKQELAQVINGAMATVAGSSPVSRVMSMLALSLAEICVGKEKEFVWPLEWGFVTQGELDFANDS